MRVAARNSSRATGYQNECNAAAPRWKRDCASAEQVVGNSTVPNLPSGADVASFAGSAHSGRCSVAQAANIAMANATSTSKALLEHRVNAISFTSVKTD